MEHNPVSLVFPLHHLIEVEETSMRSKLAFSALVAASLFGATTLASAQTEPATPATSNAMASMHHDTMRHHHHHMGYSHHVGYSRAQMDKSRPGGLPISRKAAD
jgi:hypothetical protein